MGWPALVQANSISLALSAAGTWLAFQVVARQAKTLNKVRLFAVTVTGTPATTDLTCDLYSDANGVPNASLESHAADSVPASGNWMQWSSFTTAMTLGTAYWLVFKNVNGTPASNNATYQWAGAAATGATASLVLGQVQAVTPFFGFGKVHTTNSGTAWATSVMPVVAGPRLQYSDSTYDGMPVSAITRPGSVATGDSTFGVQEVGAKFNVPSGCTFNCRGAWMCAGKTGTPGTLSYKLYQGTTLLATTAYSVPAANVSSVNNGDFYYLEFSSPVALSHGNGPYRLTMVDGTAGDASTNRYSPLLYTWDSDSNSQTLKPLDGTLSETVTTNNAAVPPVFTDTTTSCIPFMLVGDTVSGEFTSSGGGAGPLVIGG
jgi:hypothetical protein